MDKDDRHENHCGFSRDILTEHYNHYPAVQLNKIKEIEARLTKADVAMADPNFCPLRSLKIEYTHALNSLKLHKYFFENISQELDTQPSLEMLHMLERDFGSAQEWDCLLYT